MHGKVHFVDSFSGEALIEGDDGRRYEFRPPAGADRLGLGHRVTFTPVGDTAEALFDLDAAPSRAAGWAERPTRVLIPWALFSFSGRMRRSHFWIGSITVFLLWLLVAFYLRLWLVTLPFLWPNLALGVKRLHDMGRSGGFTAIPLGVSTTALVAMVVVAALLKGGDEAAAWVGVIFLAAAVFLLGFWLWLGIAKSQTGSNAYGPNPKFSIADTADAFT